MLPSLLALSLPSLAATLTVADDGSASYTSIQDAIDDATTGDTITVAAGTYTECIDTGGKDLVIEGAGADDVTINGMGTCTNAVTIALGETVQISGIEVRNGSGRAIYVEDSILELVDAQVRSSGTISSSAGIRGGGLAVVGGIGILSGVELDGNSGYYGGNVYVGDGGSLSVTDSTISNGQAYYGAGLFLDDDGDEVELSIDDSRVETNQAWYGGSGLQAAGTATVTSNQTTWYANGYVSSEGGAVSLLDGATFTSTDDSFRDNGMADSTYVFGGAIYGTGTDIHVEGSSFSGNAGYYGGAIYVTGDSSLSTTDASFLENTAVAGGAVSVLDGSTWTDDGSSFSENTSSSSGGAVLAGSEAMLSLSDTWFTGNDAVTYGGALYVTSTSGLTLDGAVLDSNTAGYDGGAIELYYLQSTTTISGSEFTDNSAGGRGGGICSYYYSDLDISSTRFEGNSAGSYGGGVYLYPYASLSASDSSFVGNSAANTGGGLYANASSWSYEVALADTEFDGNSATSGAGAYVGIFGTVTLDGARFSDNEATDHGGGLYLYYNDTVDIAHSWFCGNTAARGGGVYDNYQSNGSAWTNNAFVENTASDRGGGMYAYADYDLWLLNNDFLGNSAGYGGGLYALYAYPTFTNNLVAWTVDGAAVYAADSYSGSYYATVTYNDWWENTGGDAGGYFTFLTDSDGNIAEDPDLTAISLDGDCSNDDLVPSVGSPLIDAGDPKILDPSGDRSDIGIYGGPDSLVQDADADGWYDTVDCDDADATINPGATEVCDDVDNDCDDAVDEAGAVGETTFYEDADGDGYGNPDSTTLACEGSALWVDDASDCDDSDGDVHPGATEIAYDGIDNDCTDGDLTDVDGDGEDSEAVGGGDCDDADPAIHSGATETWYDGVDQDCSGGSDYDADADGDDSDAYGGGDCDDADPAIHSGADDVPDDGIDQDCDGEDATTGGDGGATDGGASDGGSSDGGASDGGASDGGSSDGGASDGGKDDGCACSSGRRSPGGLAGGLAVLLGLVGVRRRRRS